MPKLVYNAAPTLSRFHKSQAMVRFVVGPVGSGKSHSMIMEMLKKSVEQRPYEGIRKTRWVIIRNTRDQLRSTTLKDIQALLDPIINYKVYESTVYVHVDLPDGTRVESEWLLMPLETPDDQRRLLSTQLTGAFVEEFREVDYQLIGPLLGRLGRYPSRAMGGPSWYGLIGSSNPFSEGSEWFKSLVADLPAEWQFFRQPGGLTWPELSPNPEAENLENLPPGYYQNLIKGQPLEFIKVHACGLFGDDLSGQVVFRDSFSRDWHVADGETFLAPGNPLTIGLDLGRTPCAVITQYDARGRLIVHDEVISEGMGLETFGTDLLLPRLRDERFQRHRGVVIIDPAGVAKSSLSELSSLDVLKDLGLAAAPASTNDIGPRLRAIESLLLRGHGGEPDILIDPRCETLIRALTFEYKYKRLKTGRTEDKPDKTHPWSDVVDALGYAALGATTGVTARHIQRQMKRNSGATRRRVSAGAWT